MSCLTTCPYCGVGCGVQTDLIDGEIKGVKGDANHPANSGRLCVKGSSLHETVAKEGRVTHPEINGKQVSWDVALDDVATRLKRTVEEHGPDSVAFYLSGQLLTEDYYVANKLIKGYIGTANVDTNSRLCMASSVVGHKRAFGSDTVPCSYEDIELADMLVLVGSNAAWNHPILFQRMVKAKKENPNMKVVVVDPRETATSKLADLQLSIKPGSDARLFNGALSYLAEHQQIDQAYINAHTEGFDAALEAAKASSGDIRQLAKDCGIALDDLMTFFTWYGATKKVITFYSQGVNQSSSGSDNVNAILNCHLAMGKIGKPGMGPFSLTGQPNAMGGREVGGLANQLAAHMDFAEADVDRVQRFWASPTISKQPGLKAVDMFQAIEDGKIKFLWVMATNPLVSLPNANQIQRALEKCETVVVSENVHGADTAKFAHVKLPATGWGEKNGTVTNSDRTMSRQRGLVTPVGEAMHDWWIMSEVAKRMGFEDAFAYEHPYEIFAEHAALSGFENNGKRDFDISLYANITREEYDNFAPIQWPVTKDAPQGTPRMLVDGRFYTPSGRGRL
ncbi:MAG: molybdopterin-dependent oxidoreductase, partial [Pontibacterium sp.]